MSKLGEQLIFLISQPRSGSTLLQHILGSHSDIHTLPEPWLMLHLVYGSRSGGIEAEYNAQYSYLALKDFLKRTPDGEAAYDEAVRSMANHMYNAALASSGKRYFLDKTPRYYFIIPELYRIFPAAKFIFLLRNPLAVLSSILEVNLEGNWMGLFERDRKHDILSAPHLIVNGIKQLGDNATVVHYETLVSKPEETIKHLCKKIRISYEPDMLDYGDKVWFNGTTFVDPKSIYKHQQPVKDYLGSWISRFNSPQKSQLAMSYLESLGEDTIKDMGYSFSDTMKSLAPSIGNKKSRRLFLKLLSKSPQDLHWSTRFMLHFRSSLESRGFSGTLGRCVRFIVKGH